MIHVTYKDLLEFAKEQDPQALVEMIESNSEDSCGCLMVQYGRAKFGESEFRCGCTNWWNKEGDKTFAVLEANIFCTGLRGGSTYTYSQVVEKLEEYLEGDKGTPV